MLNDATILLVEDNPDDIKLTLRAFKQNNISNDIVVVHDGQEALDYLFAEDHCQPEKGMPALVLLDLKLPKVDGHEVLQRIREDEQTKFLPVVILTSSSEEKDLVRSYEKGCNSYIQKPVDFGQFVEAVRQLGMYWVVLNKRPQSTESNTL
ncbi:MAG: response regulator [Sphaerochaetaceae bacterium]|nr:response regulator [Sphaerochaetaceae bacterium]